MLIRHTDLSTDYFILINVRYLEHICKGFLNNNPNEFKKAYSLIDILSEIGALTASEQLKQSLDTILENTSSGERSITYVKLDNLD